MKTNKTLAELYSFPRFRAGSRLKGMMEDPQGRIIALERRQKKQSARYAGQRISVITIRGFIGYGTWIAAVFGYTWNSNIGEWNAGSAGP